MEGRLRISVSGIRGIVPEALNVEVASKFASAFSSYLEEGRIAICRDSRFSSQMLEMAAVSSIIAAGLGCTEFGEIPISFLQFQINRDNFSGGIAVSAGHNPLPWNAVILLNEAGFYLETTEGSEVFNVYEAGNFKKVSWQDLGQVEKANFPLESYLKELSFIVNIDNIKKAQFKVVADPCNGVVSPYLEDFSTYFNLQLVSINDDPAQPFPHPPEPAPENASQVEAVIKASEADLGFLLNSDGSRISFVTEKGLALSSEFSLPLCLLALQKKIKKAVSTVATSSLTDWAAEKAGVKLFRTRVGQSAVVHSMQAEGAEAGGEGSGSLAYLTLSPAYDSLLALALVLNLMADKQKTLSEIVAPFPILFRKTLKIEVPPVRIYRIMDKLEEIFSQERPDFTDGIRVERKDAWFIIRPSMTEFILRILIEGKNPDIVPVIEEEIRERVEQ